ncbi:ceramide glucosyltransferase-like isoform X1 [Tubulanus polymorphus]|uniref:ceramide glucosyltransferase-like isoform X1 n=1 Tax=Tubulanus polymorphus TaxID=672921 RepID=UPI003DA3C8BD
MAPVDVALHCLAIISLLFWISLFLIHIVAITYGKWKLYRKPSQPSPEEPRPGVSILKPLTGVDPNLYTNLETFFKMDYPSYEILFCIQDEMDPSIMVVKSLMEKYPKVDAKVFIGGKKVGLNPKINNMVQGYEASKNDLILISDSGLQMKEDSLSMMVASLYERKNIGMVHQIPHVCPREGFAGVLETVYFGTQHAKLYLALNLAGINCTTGMSCLFRKDVMDEVGGLATFGKYLAEDFFFAKAFLDKGYMMNISTYPALQNSGYYSVSHFQNRLLRWKQLRSAMAPHTILLEPMTECFFLGATASLSVSYLFGWNSIVFFLLHMLVWFLLDYIMLRTMNEGPIQFSKFEFLVGWLFRELSSPYVMLRSHFSSAVSWRHKSYRLKWGGELEEIRDKIRV